MENHVIKQLILFSSLLMILSVKSFAQDTISDPIKDLPKEIKSHYGTDIIPDESTAMELAEVILKNRYRSTNFKKLKPFGINLIADDKVWDIKIVQNTFRVKTTEYHVRLNKNTGEVLNIWVKR